MTDIPGRRAFKCFNQEFVVDERYTVTKELGQGAYGIVWYVFVRPGPAWESRNRQRPRHP